MICTACKDRDHGKCKGCMCQHGDGTPAMNAEARHRLMVGPAPPPPIKVSTNGKG